MGSNHLVAALSLFQGLRSLSRGKAVANCRIAVGLTTLLLVFGIVGARANDAVRGKLLIDEAWARPTPPGISVGAVYLNITNRGATTDQLVAVSSPLAEHSEIHETSTHAGVMSMRPVTELACPPGATVKIRPGGAHIMLFGLKQPWLPGSEVPLTLTFRLAGSVSMTVPVQASH